MVDTTHPLKKSEMIYVKQTTISKSSQLSVN